MMICTYMFASLLSSLGGWWNRLVAGRRTHSQPPAEAMMAAQAAGTAAAPDSPNSIVEATRPKPEPSGGNAPPTATIEPAVPAPLAAEHPATSADEAEKCLAEVLGVEALPVALPRSHTVDPQVRERTLAALNSLRQIPALQSLAQGFMRAMNQPEVAIADVITAIEKDSALCVRVLRMANTVLISPEQRIEDLETAVQMLGVARVRKAAQALFTLRDANRVAEGFDWRHLWIHALGTAAIADELEQQLRASADSQVYLAALLHDVGKIVLSTIASEAYRDVLIFAWHENGRLEDLERERLGVDHREAGVMFGQHNQLPPVVIEAIAHHDCPQQAKEHRFEVALVSIANYLSKAHGLGFSGARLDERDGEFADLPAWGIIQETCGFRPDPDAVEQEMNGFVAALRVDLSAVGGAGE